MKSGRSIAGSAEEQALVLAPFPHPLDALIGRDQDVAALHALLLRSDVRLLNLTGPGGVGKTRLAIAAAGRAAADFAGVGYVGLSAIRDPDLVVPTIAQALAPREVDPHPPADRLRAALNDRHFLLVLDNFEQIVDAAPRIAKLLAEHAELHVLVTSRAVLHLSGERTFPVLPLGLPDGSPASVEDALSAPAVRLFADRAEASDPRFAVDAANAVAVSEICRRLDGLPLAIELAAARIRYLSPAALLSRLESRLPLPTGGPRDHPERLRTMRDAIAWSDDLLEERERRLFESVAIFIGGFTLEAAEAIGHWPLAQQRTTGGNRPLGTPTANSQQPTANSPSPSISSLPSSPRAWCAIRATSPASRATGCWRRSANLAWNAWRRAGERRMCARAMPTGVWLSPSARRQM